MSKFARYKEKEDDSYYIYPHKHCSQCGDMIDEASKYCKECYEKIQDKKQKKAERSWNPLKKIKNRK